VSVALTVAQLVGALALLVGVWLLLPLAGALAVDGALVLVLATLAEAVLTRAHSARSDARRGTNPEGLV
jgi:hypothetical protein